MDINPISPNASNTQLRENTDARSKETIRTTDNSRTSKQSENVKTEQKSNSTNKVEVIDKKVREIETEEKVRIESEQNNTRDTNKQNPDSGNIMDVIG